MPQRECRECPGSHAAINGLFCRQLNKYVQYEAMPPCRPRQNDDNMNNNQLAIIRPENIQAIVQAAPQSYNDNKNSHDRCVSFGQGILNAIKEHGMDDELDRQAAAFIDKARRTVKVMNERRSPVTKLFDEVRTAFTTLENEIDPAKPGTVAYGLQQLRNQHAAKKRAEQERRLREEMARRQAEEARRKYRMDVEDDFRRQYSRFEAESLHALQTIDSGVTLETYAEAMQRLQAFPRQLPDAWVDARQPSVPIPCGLAQEEAAAVVAKAREQLRTQLREQYDFEVTETLQALIDRMPSKKANLEKIAQASAEEAARIKAEMEARQSAEAKRAEKERAEREAEEKRKAELERKTAEMTSLFDGQATASACQTKAKVTKRISLLNPEGIMPVISLWWSKEGCTLSVEQLSKMFKKQIAFCEKLANKDEVLIQHESVEYVDEVKAK